jgi:hypothetical protein
MLGRKFDELRRRLYARHPLDKVEGGLGVGRQPASRLIVPCQNFLTSNLMKSPSALWGTRTRRGFRLPERTQRYTHAARHPGYDLIQL